MVFLVRKVAEKNAREMLLTGDVFKADKALQYGLINYIIEPDELDDVVYKFAQKLCNQTSIQSVELIKEMLANVQSMDINEALEYAAQTNAKARATDDCKRGIAAFLNKEKLSW
jgi:methylglutaconyl-CoA hydratase